MDGDSQKKTRKPLDMLASVIVNYNSMKWVIRADRRLEYAKRITLAREQKRNELREENET
jgi:hypothetical protein